MLRNKFKECIHIFKCMSTHIRIEAFGNSSERRCLRSVLTDVFAVAFIAEQKSKNSYLCSFWLENLSKICLFWFVGRQSFIDSTWSKTRHNKSHKNCVWMNISVTLFGKRISVKLLYEKWPQKVHKQFILI